MNSIYKFVCLLLIFAACQSGQKQAAQPTLASITKTGQIIMGNGELKSIPHFGDPEWMILYVVRHCEKAKDGTKNPDLSPEGQARAERLGRIMDDVRLDRVCSTNLKRTLQTAQAVALMTGAPPHENFPPEAQQDWLADLMQSGAGKQFFYAGHSNTVPQLLNELLGKQQFADIAEDDFGRFFIVATKGVGQTEVLEFRY